MKICYCGKYNGSFDELVKRLYDNEIPRHFGRSIEASNIELVRDLDAINRFFIQIKDGKGIERTVGELIVSLSGEFKLIKY